VNPKPLDFAGAKVLLLCDGYILTYLRDAKPDLPWAAKWDLPGGGREGAESPEACVLRELHEEFGLRLPRDRLLWARAFPAILDPSRLGWFFAGSLAPAEVSAISFGDEGQNWRLLPVAEWLDHPEGVTPLQANSRIALADLGWQ